MPQNCAIVTGGGRNIGQAISLRLQADGYRVFALDIVEPEAEALRPDAVLVDLSDAEATRTAVQAIAAEHRVTCLVNNVGIVAPAPLEEVRLEDFELLMNLNLRTSIVCAQILAPGMRKHGGGRIVFNTSRVTKGKLDRTLYSATKGAAQSMARTWALELAPDGITVNCVAPGPIATTAFWENNPPDAPKTRAIIDMVPIGRMGTTEDIANAVSFFCDDRAGFVTGQTLFVCGGVTVG
ncbi:SDR family oxidoreductase [uncultured Maritimibacter sp.]|jgi:NAD(P)-dependent dehydrogenase (short-subunit alcohol dehydrogenase family)|uniref:SDR family NAD(P)-dependent oxidoreductase n=1 Tax=uncultured Maritimibacter sp. TaxID=991866 RepID=UPI000ADF5572|nr:SDR family oxidoreductase [uncultured Maritimibacter sp.]